MKKYKYKYVELHYLEKLFDTKENKEILLLLDLSHWFYFLQHLLVLNT